MDGPLANRGGCPTADFRKPACHHKRSGKTFCFEATHRLAFGIRSRDSIHPERSPAKNYQLVKRAFSKKVYHARLTSSLEILVKSFLSCSWNFQSCSGKELDPFGSVHNPGMFSGQKKLLQCLRFQRDDPAGGNTLGLFLFGDHPVTVTCSFVASPCVTTEVEAEFYDIDLPPSKDVHDDRVY